MDIILIGFWIWERASGRTKLTFGAWLRILDAEDRVAHAEAPAGWVSSPPAKDHGRSDLIEQPASSLSFSR